MYDHMGIGRLLPITNLYVVVVMFLALFVVVIRGIEESREVLAMADANDIHYGHEALSYTFYLHSCPRAYDLVREHMQLVLRRDPSQAAAILRLFFHDCFVQGCDGSVLLNYTKWINDEGRFDTTIIVSEQTALPNLNSLRSSAFQIIEDMKEVLEDACPLTVSCADILALAARDAIFMVKGPWIPIMTGRRDSYMAAPNETVIANLPVPTQGFGALKQIFEAKGLDVKDLIALSGAHTIGRTHCHVVDTQLHPSVSSDLDPSFATNLTRICGGGGGGGGGSIFRPQASHNARDHLTLHLDGFSPDIFDNSYYRNVEARAALFHSDASLLSLSGRKNDTNALLVTSFARSQDLFFEHFRASFIKMSQIGVISGDRGEVRRRCNIPNSSA